MVEELRQLTNLSNVHLQQTMCSAIHSKLWERSLPGQGQAQGSGWCCSLWRTHSHCSMWPWLSSSPVTERSLALSRILKTNRKQVPEVWRASCTHPEHCSAYQIWLYPSPTTSATSLTPPHSRSRILNTSLLTLHSPPSKSWPAWACVWFNTDLSN